MSVISTLTAAAARFTRKLSGARQTANTSGSRQSLAWDLYMSVPEVRFYAQYVSGTMAGARLYAAKRLDDGTLEPAPDGHPAADIVSKIAGGPSGQTELLADFGPQLVVAGEGWIVIRPTGDGEAEWRVLSTEEIKQDRDQLTAEWDDELLEIPAYDPDNPDPDAPAAIRVWDSHPRRRREADSPVLGSIPILEELRLLTASIAAIARSRLYGRGIVTIPAGATFPTPKGQAAAEDDLLEVMMEVSSTSIRDPESAAAVVPIILQLPDGGRLEHHTFESAFDELAMKLRDEAIRRFATGAEVPAEIVLGMGDVNHWSANLLAAEAVTRGAIPRINLVTNALTVDWLQPLLEAEGLEDWREWLVASDNSGIHAVANRAQLALEAFREGLISGEAGRRELGFDEGDAPTPEERAAQQNTTTSGDISSPTPTADPTTLTEGP